MKRLCTDPGPVVPSLAGPSLKQSDLVECGNFKARGISPAYNGFSLGNVQNFQDSEKHYVQNLDLHYEIWIVQSISSTVRKRRNSKPAAD